MNRRQTSWSNLPPELLSAIAIRLETRSDILKFRAVCQNWRQSATFSLLLHKNILSPLLPHKLSTTSPPLLNKNGNCVDILGNPISFKILLVASSVFLLRSSQNPELPPWLITVEEVNPGKFYCRKPLSRVNIKDLPENFPKVLHLSDFKVTEIGKFCTLRLADNPLDMFRKKCWKSSNKVVLFVDPNCKNTPTIDNCTAMVLYDNGTLSAIRLKNEQQKHISPKGRKFDDIVNMKGKLYAVDRRGRAYKMDYNSLSMREIVDKPLSDGSSTDKRKCLAVLWGELYLVCNCPGIGTDFEVYRLMEKEEEWEQVKGIGNNILFVTYDGCFFARTKDFPGWRGNTIVYYSDTFPQLNGENFELTSDLWTKDDELGIGVFHYGHGNGWPISNSRLYSDVFWPPPAWLSPDTNLSTSTSEEEDEELENDSSGQSTSQPLAQVETSQAAGNIRNVSMDITSAKTTQYDVYKGKIPGVYVSPQFVPTLNKIWDKHGNIIAQTQGQHVMQNNDQLKWALESLANTVMLLQSPSGMCLNDSQVAQLNSTVYQLQCMHFKLDWLHPFIQKALALHKGNQQLNFIKGLEISKSNLLAQLRDVECGLAKHRKLAVETFVALPPVELKNVLS
ncbi:F-box protein SKIP23 [Beta vulgaris subsp. vulgaris]|uniref:F-box protein SKIP23 n=1 Tax=Beta vulgaris subsp. vulgaris TaxID=3555 RepID=UPI002036D320|nr:F-box protein SKIP23 [Beta vulgaris subsp. vulgaris]